MQIQAKKHTHTYIQTLANKRKYRITNKARKDNTTHTNNCMRVLTNADKYIQTHTAHTNTHIETSVHKCAQTHTLQYNTRRYNTRQYSTYKNS